MGMVKSAARVALRGDTELGALLTLLNGVIFDLKSPAMYATFAGLQWRDGALSFAVAAHPRDPAVPARLTRRRRADDDAAPDRDVRGHAVRRHASRRAAGRPVRDPDRRPDRGLRPRRTGVRPGSDEGDDRGAGRGPARRARAITSSTRCADTAGSWTISRCCWCGSCRRLTAATLTMMFFTNTLLFGSCPCSANVPLDRTRAGHVGRPLDALRLRVVDQRLAVHRRRHALALHDDLHREPLVVLGRGLAYVLDRVEAGGPLRVGVRVVDLDFVALRRPAAFLVGGVEIDAGVRARRRHDVGLELEVLEVVVADRADVVEVRARPVDDDGAVGDREGRGVLADLPAVERLAVEERDPPGALLRGQRSAGDRDERGTETDRYGGWRLAVDWSLEVGRWSCSAAAIACRRGTRRGRGLRAA